MVNVTTVKILGGDNIYSYNIANLLNDWNHLAIISEQSCDEK